MGGSTAYPPLHTAEHLVTALVHSRFPGVSSFRSRLKSRKAVLTFRCSGHPVEQDRLALEQDLLRLCTADLPVSARLLDRDEAERRLPNMHQLPSTDGAIRAVRIGAPPDVADERACIGTHVSSTGQILQSRIPTLRPEGDQEWRLTLIVG